MPVVAGALALAALLAVWMLRPTPRRNGRTTPIASLPSPGGAVAAPDALPAVSRAAHAQLQPKRTALSPEPEVLVPSGQLALVMKLAEGVDAGPVNSAEFVARWSEIEVPLEIRPLETHALEFPPMRSVSEDALNSAGDHGGD